MTIRDKLVAQCGDENLLFMDGFDDCIIGLCDIHCQNPRVAYDVGKILKALQAQGMTEDEASEYYEYNIECCHVGEYTPALILVDDTFTAQPAEKEALNLRIKRLEEAGDELLDWVGCDVSDANRKLIIDSWRQAKEAKP